MNSRYLSQAAGIFFSCAIANCAFISCVSVSAAPVTDPLGTSRTISVGTSGGGAVGRKSYPRTLPLADKELVLTFDDGPLPGLTSSVIDALAAENVKATFFLIGRNARANPELVRRLAVAGHSVAHHSGTHPMTLRDIPEEKARDNINAGFAAVEAAQGASTSTPRTGFFRYPGFGDSPALNAWLASRNIVIFGADIWASDWVDMSPEAELALLMGRIRKAGRGIVLLHDTRAQTAKMLPALLRMLKSEGYKIVHIVPGSGTLETQSATSGWTSETERFLSGRKSKASWPPAPKGE